jgi:predicted GNAT family N-acyltransferase
MNVIDTLTETHVAQLSELYQQEWWAKGRTLEETKNCVAGSQICVGLVGANNELVGFARVLTDFTFKALIFDVIVRKDHRKAGLGDRLLSLIKSHEKLQDVKHFELYCLPEMHGFYARHGFSTDTGDIRLMRLVNG